MSLFGPGRSVFRETTCENWLYQYHQSVAFSQWCIAMRQDNLAFANYYHYFNFFSRIHGMDGQGGHPDTRAFRGHFHDLQLLAIGKIHRNRRVQEIDKVYVVESGITGNLSISQEPAHDSHYFYMMSWRIRSRGHLSLI